MTRNNLVDGSVMTLNNHQQHPHHHHNSHNGPQEWQQNLQQNVQNQQNRNMNNSNSNNDVVQYIDLEEFLFENAVAVAQQQHVETKVEVDIPEKIYQVNLEQRANFDSTNSYPGSSPPHHNHQSPGSVKVMTPPHSNEELILQHQQQQQLLSAGQQGRGQSVTPPLSGSGGPTYPQQQQPLPSIRTLSGLPHQQPNLVGSEHTAVKSSLSPGSSSSGSPTSSSGHSSRHRRISYHESSDNSASSPLGHHHNHSPDSPTYSNSGSTGGGYQNSGNGDSNLDIKHKKPVKRSRKESVPEENKDEKYWKRRAKNNEAAKRSRDLRREKENQIMQRVAILERENQLLIQEMKNVRLENENLKKRLARYEVV